MYYVYFILLCCKVIGIIYVIKIMLPHELLVLAVNGRWFIVMLVPANRITIDQPASFIHQTDALMEMSSWRIIS